MGSKIGDFTKENALHYKNQKLFILVLKSFLPYIICLVYLSDECI